MRLTRGPWVVAALALLVAAALTGVFAVNASVSHEPLAAVTGDVELGAGPPAGSGGPPPPPVPNAVVDLFARGSVVASTTTDSSGHFQMSAPAGSYSLKVIGHRCPAERVGVQRSKPIDVRIHCAP